MNGDSLLQQQFFNWDQEEVQEDSLARNVSEVRIPNVEVETALLLISASKKSAVRSAALDKRCSQDLGRLLVSTEVLKDKKSIPNLLSVNNKSKILLIVDFNHCPDIEVLKFLSKHHKADIDRVIIFVHDTNYNRHDRELANVLDNFPNRAIKLKGLNNPDNRYIAFFKAVDDIRHALVV